jgi:hypothetical protein
MQAIGMKSYNTYDKIYNDLLNFGFVNEIVKSRNQYTACIIALSYFDKANNKALNKAIDNTSTEHIPKQSKSTVQDTIQITDSIIKPKTNKPKTNKPKIIKPKTSNTPAPLFVTTGGEKHIFSFCKECFLSIYLEKCKSGEYYFQPVDGEKLKSILKKIVFKMKEKSPGVTEFENEKLTESATWYFTNAFEFGDDWLKTNFNLANLDSKFNNIYTLIVNVKSKNNKNGGQKSGSAATNKGTFDAINDRFSGTGPSQ